MEKRTREILALVLLVVLGVAAVCAMAWYMLVGHNWNHAATRIDDMVGSMDGYTVVLYQGVAREPIEPERSIAGVPIRSSADESSSGSAESSGSRTDGSSQSAANEEAGSSSSSAAPNALVTEKPKNITVSAVSRSYRKKGASVLVIPRRYATRFDDPSILLRNGRRFGVFSLTGKYRDNKEKFRSDMHGLKACSVDSIIAVARDKALLKGKFNDIDLLVLMRDAGLPESGEYRGSMFCVDSPLVGEVGAVIISPSGVMTARTVREI